MILLEQNIKKDTFGAHLLEQDFEPRISKFGAGGTIMAPNDPNTILYTANVFPIESAGNPRVAKCSL